MPKGNPEGYNDMRKDVSAAYDKDMEPKTVTCAHCGKKTPVGKSTTAIGGGTAAAAGGGGGG